METIIGSQELVSRRVDKLGELVEDRLEQPQPQAENFKDSISESLIRNYATNLGPLNIEYAQAAANPVDEPQSSFSTSSTQIGDWSPDGSSLAGSPKLPRLPKSFLNHGRGGLSLDSTPRQSSIRPVASSSITATATSSSTSPKSCLNSPLRQQQLLDPSAILSTALNELKVSQTPSTARFASLQSPCFFHQRFDDAVNIDRVMEEIEAETEGMSHTRLLQTATSVREISKQLQRRPIKRAVRNVMIVTKARDNSLVSLTRDLAEWLLTTPRYGSTSGVNVYVDAKLRTSKRFDADSLIAKNPAFPIMLQYWTPDLCYSAPETFDLVLTLGGDGTVLFTSCLFQRVVPPILAFSLGSLGFLTNFEFADYKTSLNSIMGDQGMRVNLRMRFTCTVYRANLNRTRGQKGVKVNPVDVENMVEGEQFEVLNELVIDRGPSPYVSNLELYGDDELLTVVQADGCIFSTPTGSTAYSLSAGGPLTHPSIPGILLTPICPHTLSFRPMVLSDSLMLKVCVPRNSRSTAYASFDGKGRVELRRGDCVVVEAGRYPFPTVVGEGGTGGEWFESVRRALRWNTRGAVQKSFYSSNQSIARGSVKDAALLEVDEDQDGEEEELEEEDMEWDINPDPVEIHSSADSGWGSSEANSSCASPRRSSGIV
jgi:NAD+ kinase